MPNQIEDRLSFRDMGQDSGEFARLGFGNNLPTILDLWSR